MVLNVVVRFVPTSVTEAIITTAIRAAIKPYSMAVTPASSLKKFFNRVISCPPKLRLSSVRIISLLSNYFYHIKKIIKK